jgi:FAD/FMN-containing dehydrogenase/Fe-S oxidoreductase
VDEQQREHIRDDLKGIIKGELLFDDLSRALYSTDASIFQVEPLGVVAPRDEADLQALVRYAAEHHLPLVPRGAGSGLAGEALGSGLVVDLSRHFRSVLEVGSDTVRVQPGVVLRDLNARLARDGRQFAPDPASGEQCTLGGMLATNASGSRSLKHGYTRDHVAAVRAVFDTGEAATVGREPLRPANGASGRVRDAVTAAAALLNRNAELIHACQPRTRFNRCGYLLQDVLGPDYVDLARLLVGSEGTLAVFTEATLRTVPLPVGRGLVLLSFEGMDAALRAAQRALPSGPACCELIDHRLLKLVRESNGTAGLIPPAAEVVLLVEYESDTAGGAAAAANALADQLYRGERLALHAVTATEPDAIDRLWGLRATALPSLYGLRGGPQPAAFVEDVGVPVEELPTFLRKVQEVLQQFETTASFLVHAGTGQVHTRPFIDLQRPQDTAKLWALAEQIHGLALELNGTISTQHGTGLARTPWVSRQYGRLYPVLRELKAIFDPYHLFNPGKIIGPDPERPSWPLRRPVGLVDGNGTAHEPGVNGTPRDEARTPIPVLSLNWKPAELASEVAACNGCGACRTTAPARRMCPIFRATHTEAATPRAKANLLRHLLRDAADGHALSADAVREVADLCVNCKMCAAECPARVNIPKLMLEAKAANVAEHGLGRADWVMARVESFAALGSSLAALSNLALASPIVRWLLEKLFHVARKRRLPPFARRNFLKRAARRGWTKPPPADRPRVAYFADTFATYNDPQLAEAAVAVLQHNGFNVFVPPGQVGCGAAPLAKGDVEAAREAAEANLRLLADLAREGYRIVCSEPTAALMLRKDYLDLCDSPDARLVAGQVTELTAFLWELHQQGKLRTEFQPLDLDVGHHVPCHVKALGPPAGPALLALIPGLRVHTIDVSCSGMAGTFGLQAENYATSLEAGRPMLEELARPHVRAGASECSACRLQMQDGSGKRAMHPVQYLALAYGLMPELAQRLQKPIRGLLLR